jgi:hypothetical protein
VTDGSKKIVMKLKMWVGNLDGTREGLVIAPTKKRAIEVVGSGRTDFNTYWHKLPVDPKLEPEVLYTRRFAAHDTTWIRGRCP